MGARDVGVRDVGVRDVGARDVGARDVGVDTEVSRAEDLRDAEASPVSEGRESPVTESADTGESAILMILKAEKDLRGGVVMKGEGGGRSEGEEGGEEKMKYCVVLDEFSLAPWV